MGEANLTAKMKPNLTLRIRRSRGSRRKVPRDGFQGGHSDGIRLEQYRRSYPVDENGKGAIFGARAIMAANE